MTSGLFNTGGAGDLAGVTSDTSAVQPETSMSNKFIGHDDFLAETLNDNFDMDMFGDLGSGLDQLGDASLDSFTDLTALLSEHNTFFDQLKEEGTQLTEEGTALFSDIGKNAEPSASTSLKRSFDEMEAGSSDLDVLTARVSLPTPNLDHDYTSKRPRMSTLTEEPSVQEVSVTPLPAPTPSTSFTFVEPLEDKSRYRREKNNIASKRSREIRKQKFVGMESEAEHLIVDNARLEKRVAELEKLAKKMKEILVSKMAGK